MKYNQAVSEYQRAAKIKFAEQLDECACEVLTDMNFSPDNIPMSKYFIEYHEQVKILMRNQLHRDSEQLKRISFECLQKYEDASDIQKKTIENKIVSNHDKVYNKLKSEYERMSALKGQQFKREADSYTRKIEREMEQKSEVEQSLKTNMISVNFIIILTLILLILYFVIVYHM